MYLPFEATSNNNMKVGCPTYCGRKISSSKKWIFLVFNPHLADEIEIEITPHLYSYVYATLALDLGGKNYNPYVPSQCLSKREVKKMAEKTAFTQIFVFAFLNTFHCLSK